MEHWKKMYNVVEFRRVRGINYPSKPWPVRMFVSGEVIELDMVELSRLTLITFFRSVLRNFITLNYLRLLLRFYHLGFLDSREGCYIGLKDWRWDFWNVLKERKAREQQVCN